MTKHDHSSILDHTEQWYCIKLIFRVTRKIEIQRIGLARVVSLPVGKGEESHLRQCCTSGNIGQQSGQLAREKINAPSFQRVMASYGERILEYCTFILPLPTNDKKRSSKRKRSIAGERASKLRLVEPKVRKEWA